MKHRFLVHFLLHVPRALLNSILSRCCWIVYYVWSFLLDRKFLEPHLSPCPWFQCTLTQREGEREGRGEKGRDWAFCFRTLFLLSLCGAGAQCFGVSLPATPPPTPHFLFILPSNTTLGRGGRVRNIPVPLSAFSLPVCLPQFRNDCFKVEFMLFQSLYASY